MKVNVEVECTAEEARRLMGLPDLAPVHDVAVAQMIDAVRSGGISPEFVQSMIKTWSPMGESGMRIWQQLIEQVGGSATKR
jgi:hypothetical protein